MMRKKYKKETQTQTQTNRNGRKVLYDNIWFDSNLEKYCYIQLKKANIEFEYTPTTYELLPKIVYEGNDKKTNSVLALKYTPDFVGKNFIIETKGYANERFPVVWKLFKHYLYNHKLTYQLYKAFNQKEVRETIESILKQNKNDKI